MPRLLINMAALRHNLVVIHELCRHAGTECMFVFKEAALHPALTFEIMKDSPVRRLGLVAWPNNAMARIPETEIHHVYAPSPMLSQKTADCDCVCISSLFNLHTLAGAHSKKTPHIRICLEVGDGRDGVLPEEMPELCEAARSLGFSLRGISINFACLSSEAPGMGQLNFAARMLEEIRSFCLPEADISAGGTDMLELAAQTKLPSAIREIRCGTGVSLGEYPLSGHSIPGTRQDAFRIESQILECRLKKGRLMALFDMGAFHTSPAGLRPPFPGMIFAGASSAYTSFDVTDCPENMREGMTLFFRPDYHALSGALCSQALPVVMEQA